MPYSLVDRNHLILFYVPNPFSIKLEICININKLVITTKLFNFESKIITVFFHKRIRPKESSLNKIIISRPPRETRPSSLRSTILHNSLRELKHWDVWIITQKKKFSSGVLASNNVTALYSKMFCCFMVFNFRGVTISKK